MRLNPIIGKIVKDLIQQHNLKTVIVRNDDNYYYVNDIDYFKFLDTLTFINLQRLSKSIELNIISVGAAIDSRKRWDTPKQVKIKKQRAIKVFIKNNLGCLELAK